MSAQLARAVASLRFAERGVDDAIRAARVNGDTWQEIGAHLKVTGSAAFSIGKRLGLKGDFPRGRRPGGQSAPAAQ